MRKPTFLIWSPPYSESSGGIMVLHLLAHELSKLGYATFLSSSGKNPAWQGTLCNPQQQMDWDSTIVVYPEIICGNPLNGKHIVRWALNTPGLLGGDGVYGDKDMVFLFWDYFTYWRKELILGELRMFTTDYDVFFDMKRPRSGQCHAIRKGHSKPLNQHVSNSVLIDTLPKRQLQEVFNNKEICISYDHVTYLSVQAALCGCISVVIPDGVNDKETWKAKLPHCKYGIAYGFEDIEWAKSTLHLVRPHLEAIEKENQDLLHKFIDICTERINL